MFQMDHAPRSDGGLDRGSRREVSVSRVILLGEVLFHREALARSFGAFGDVALIGSVADVHAALILAAESRPDVLVVDSPSDAVVHELTAHPLDCKIVFIGPVGEGRHQLRSRGGAIFMGASASLDEVHVALRFAKPRAGTLSSAATLPPALSAAGDSLLTLREREVTRLVAGGRSNKEIAQVCGISLATVKNHVHRILAKLSVQRRTQLAGLERDLPPAAASMPPPANGFDGVHGSPPRSRRTL